MISQNELDSYRYVSDEEMLLNTRKFPYYSMKEVADNIGTIGRTHLYKLLRDRNYLDVYNTAFEEFVEQGFFINKVTHRIHEGRSKVTNQVFVSYKGLELIRNLINANVK
jgi:phage antirepressor YoqD-like protein